VLKIVQDFFHQLSGLTTRNVNQRVCSIQSLKQTTMLTVSAERDDDDIEESFTL